MHNPIPEYASTASISIVMTMPFHLKRMFLNKWFFASNIIKTPQVLKRQSIKRRREREIIEKRKKEKDEGKEKLQESLQIKGKSIFWEEKNTLTSKISFLMWFHFVPLHHTISKTLSKTIEKVFLTPFGPSFNLAIYITSVIPFLFTHELHIFSL
jgi:phosphosulfolactate synthase (CoM biosynthesis protein A)